MDAAERYSEAPADAATIRARLIERH
jgi:hypothetical protein